MRLFVDGQRFGDWRVTPLRPAFSRDGRRLAFVAENEELQPERNQPGHRRWVVLDGQALPAANDIWFDPNWFQFSPDGQRYAHGEVTADGVRLVLDGQHEPTFNDVHAPRFSPDGRRFVYTAELQQGMALIEGGSQGPVYGLVGGQMFSPDSQHLAYWARRSTDRLRIVVDGKEGPEFLDLWGDLVFSPNGSRIAYLAERRGRGVLGGLRRQWVAVIDGIAGDGWDEVASSPHFSPDNSRVAYSARRGKVWSIVVDGVPGPGFDEIGPPRFGTSGRLAYLARTGESWGVVFDGAMGPSFETPVGLVPGEFFQLSPDGEHVATVGGMQDAWRPIVDDHVGPAYPGVGRVLFDARRVVFQVIDARGVHRLSIDV